MKKGLGSKSLVKRWDILEDSGIRAEQQRYVARSFEARTITGIRAMLAAAPTTSAIGF